MRSAGRVDPSAQTGTDSAPARLHRPLRLAVTAVEVLAAAALVVLAVALWGRGTVLTETDGAELTRIEGRWWGVAVAAVVLGGFLVLDAVRHALLAVRTRPRRAGAAESEVTGPPPPPARG